MRELDAVARLPAYRPGKVLRIVPLVGAGGDEQLRHLVVVQVLSDRAVGGRTERLEERQHPVLFDQLTNLFEGLRRAIAVVAADEVNFTPVNAAVLIDHGEIGGFRLADSAVARRRAAIGVGIAELDLGVADARSVWPSGQGQSASENEGRS